MAGLKQSNSNQNSHFICKQAFDMPEGIWDGNDRLCTARWCEHWTRDFSSQLISFTKSEQFCFQEYSKSLWTIQRTPIGNLFQHLGKATAKTLNPTLSCIPAQQDHLKPLISTANMVAPSWEISNLDVIQSMYKSIVVKIHFDTKHFIVGSL